MRYYLDKYAVLKWLEVPSVYHIKKDELYELDDEAFAFLQKAASKQGESAADEEFLGFCLDEGLLVAAKPNLVHSLPVKSPEPSLRYLEMQITDRCNLRCRHCYIGDAPEGHELAVSEVRSILQEFEAMQGLRVLVTGGEPLMHRKFDRINEMLLDFALRKVLFTNGVLLSGKIIGSLHMDEIQISIDGLEAAHDALRGPGSYQAAMRAVKLCLDAGIEVSVSTMIHARNLEDFEKMDLMFRRIGIKDWTVDIPCDAGRLPMNESFRVSPQEGGKYLRYGYGGGIHASSSGFGCGLHLMSVLADGRAAKCTFYGDRPAGRISDGLLACWKKIKPVRLSDLTCDCEHLETCRGGCRYRAEQLGNAAGRDLYKCFSYGIMKISEKQKGMKP